MMLHSIKKLFHGGGQSRPATWSWLRHMTNSKPVIIRKSKSRRGESKSFIDFKRVSVNAGKGGDGGLSFLSLPFKEWAGPDGGNGGNGGHVIFQADIDTKSLQKLSSLYHGQDGIKGRSSHCHGKNAEHTYVKVPIGTVIRDEEGQILGDLKKSSDLLIAARGGAGGKGNHFFLTNENRAPVVYEKGGQGQTQRLTVELKIMAHAGLVGFPNAGKSTLLRSISRAKPKVAAYPFTTLRPHIGIVEYDDHEQIAVADIPGLVTGAHQNCGLGFSFLRHIERCLCLLYVLDLSQKEPWAQFTALQYELEQYKQGLSARPHAIVANKIDIPGATDNLAELQKHTNLAIFPVSAKKKIDLEPLLLHLRDLYDQYSTEQS